MDKTIYTCVTHISSRKQNFAKFFNLRGSARETLDEEERERENSNVKHAKSFVLKRKKKWNSNVQHFNLLT